MYLKSLKNKNLFKNQIIKLHKKKIFNLHLFYFYRNFFYDIPLKFKNFGFFNFKLFTSLFFYKICYYSHFSFFYHYKKILFYKEYFFIKINFFFKINFFKKFKKFFFFFNSEIKLKKKYTFLNFLSYKKNIFFYFFFFQISKKLPINFFQKKNYKNNFSFFNIFNFVLKFLEISFFFQIIFKKLNSFSYSLKKSFFFSSLFFFFSHELYFFFKKIFRFYIFIFLNYIFIFNSFFFDFAFFKIFWYLNFFNLFPTHKIFFLFKYFFFKFKIIVFFFFYKIFFFCFNFKIFNFFIFFQQIFNIFSFFFLMFKTNLKEDLNSFYFFPILKRNVTPFNSFSFFSKFLKKWKKQQKIGIKFHQLGTSVSNYKNYDLKKKEKKDIEKAKEEYWSKSKNKSWKIVWQNLKKKYLKNYKDTSLPEISVVQESENKNFSTFFLPYVFKKIEFSFIPDLKKAYFYQTLITQYRWNTNKQGSYLINFFKEVNFDFLNRFRFFFTNYLFFLKNHVTLSGVLYDLKIFNKLTKFQRFFFKSILKKKILNWSSNKNYFKFLKNQNNFVKNKNTEFFFYSLKKFQKFFFFKKIFLYFKKKYSPFFNILFDFLTMLLLHFKLLLKGFFSVRSFTQSFWFKNRFILKRRFAFYRYFFFFKKNFLLKKKIELLVKDKILFQRLLQRWTGVYFFYFPILFRWFFFKNYWTIPILNKQSFFFRRNKSFIKLFKHEVFFLLNYSLKGQILLNDWYYQRNCKNFFLPKIIFFFKNNFFFSFFKLNEIFLDKCFETFFIEKKENIDLFHKKILSLFFKNFLKKTKFNFKLLKLRIKNLKKKKFLKKKILDKELSVAMYKNKYFNFFDLFFNKHFLNKSKYTYIFLFITIFLSFLDKKFIKFKFNKIKKIFLFQPQEDFIEKKPTVFLDALLDLRDRLLYELFKNKKSNIVSKFSKNEKLIKPWFFLYSIWWRDHFIHILKKKDFTHTFVIKNYSNLFLFDKINSKKKNIVKINKYRNNSKINKKIIKDLNIIFNNFTKVWRYFIYYLKKKKKVKLFFYFSKFFKTFLQNSHIQNFFIKKKSSFFLRKSIYNDFFYKFFSSFFQRFFNLKHIFYFFFKKYFFNIFYIFNNKNFLYNFSQNFFLPFLPFKFFLIEQSRLKYDYSGVLKKIIKNFKKPFLKKNNFNSYKNSSKFSLFVKNKFLKKLLKQKNFFFQKLLLLNKLTEVLKRVKKQYAKRFFFSFWNFNYNRDFLKNLFFRKSLGEQDSYILKKNFYKLKKNIKSFKKNKETDLSSQEEFEISDYFLKTLSLGMEINILKKKMEIFKNYYFSRQLFCKNFYYPSFLAKNYKVFRDVFYKPRIDSFLFFVKQKIESRVSTLKNEVLNDIQNKKREFLDFRNYQQKNFDLNNIFLKKYFSYWYFLFNKKGTFFSFSNLSFKIKGSFFQKFYITSRFFLGFVNFPFFFFNNVKYLLPFFKFTLIFSFLFFSSQINSFLYFFFRFWSKIYIYIFLKNNFIFNLNKIFFFKNLFFFQFIQNFIGFFFSPFFLFSLKNFYTKKKFIFFFKEELNYDFYQEKVYKNFDFFLLKNSFLIKNIFFKKNFDFIFLKIFNKFSFLNISSLFFFSKSILNFKSFINFYSQTYNSFNKNNLKSKKLISFYFFRNVFNILTKVNKIFSKAVSLSFVSSDEIDNYAKKFVFLKQKTFFFTIFKVFGIFSFFFKNLKKKNYIFSWILNLKKKKNSKFLKKKSNFSVINYYFFLKRRQTLQWSFIFKKFFIKKKSGFFFTKMISSFFFKNLFSFFFFDTFGNLIYKSICFSFFSFYNLNVFSILSNFSTKFTNLFSSSYFFFFFLKSYSILKFFFF